MVGEFGEVAEEIHSLLLNFALFYSLLVNFRLFYRFWLLQYWRIFGFYSLLATLLQVAKVFLLAKSCSGWRIFSCRGGNSFAGGEFQVSIHFW